MRHYPIMPIYRIIPALALAVGLPALAIAQAQAPAPQPTPATTPAAAPAPTTPTKAEAKLDEAIARIKSLKSVSAELAETVEMLGQKFRLTGLYSKAPDYRVYLKLDLAGLGDTNGTMLQVCDGDLLWDYTKILGAPSLRKLKIGGILKKLDSAEFDPEMRDRMVAQLGFAGPEALLVGLRRSMAFNQLAEGTLDGRAVWIIRGQWKDYEGLTGPNQAPLPATAPLPPYVPKLSAIYLGKDDLWPYQVILQGQALSILVDDRPRDMNGHPYGPKATPRREPPSKIVLVYSNVQLDAPIPASNFAFTPPGDIQVLDGTARLEADIDAYLAEQANRKRAEAAKAGDKGGEALPQGLTVPPGPGTEPSSDPFRSTAPPPAPKQP
jgi:hypothetical protein